MRNVLRKLIDRKATIIADMEAALAKADEQERDLSADEQTAFEAKQADLAKLNQDIANRQAFLDAKDSLPAVPDANTVSDELARASTPAAGTPQIEFPAHRGTLRCFTEKDGAKVAYRFGRWLQAIAGDGAATQFCRDQGMPLSYIKHPEGVSIGAVYNEGTNTQGGYLVLPEFDRSIIRLVSKYGKFRRNARVVPMGSETKDRDRRTGGLTAYFTGESAAGTESTGSWDQVKLVAKKLMVLTRVSNELNADAVIDSADNIGWEVARAFAKKEDECGFVGDGTSTYGGIVGVNTRLTNINGVDDGGGLVLAAGNLFSEITLANFNTMVGRLPDYADSGDDEADSDALALWYCSKFFWGSVMQKLAAAAGGNTWEMLSTGARRRVFLGYGVILSETYPKADANSQIVCTLGSLVQAADLGDRQQITIAVSDSASVGGESVFERDQLAFRATERMDINVHDVGTATVAGPVVGMISAAS